MTATSTITTTMPSNVSTLSRVTPEPGAKDRYARDIITASSNLRYHALVQRLLAQGVPYSSEHHHGVVTLGGRTRELPAAFLRAVATFRLGQYLALEYASRDVAYDRSLHCEPLDSIKPDDFHLAAFCEHTGKLLGYVCLATNGDIEPRPTQGPRRGKPFPVEDAHDLNVFSAVGAHGLLTSEVREVKRFVHARDMKDRVQRLRVSIELLLGISEALRMSHTPIRAFVGDVEEQVALRHLLLVGLEVHIVDGTSPVLPVDDLMHPMYVTRETVLPFYAMLPSPQELSERSAALRAIAASPDIMESAGRLLGAAQGLVVRHEAELVEEVA